jgi:hypothetical protein
MVLNFSNMFQNICSCLKAATEKLLYLSPDMDMGDALGYLGKV